ncbi:MAG: hypothetical protein KBS81_10155, partial [Spirochaetales bacterium]|nr:hypothetical protein [Candidatus Physcosoma equi]
MELNLTSPTLIVADNFFSEFSSVESPISLSVNGVERNLKDRVRIKDVSLFYEEEEVASFDYLEIQMSLIDLFRYVVTGRNYADIHLHNGTVNVSKNLLDSFTKDDGNSSQEMVGDSSFRMADIVFPDVLKKYHFSVTVDSMDLAINEMASLEKVAAEITLGGSLKDSEAAFYIPEFHGSFGGYDAELEYIGLTFRYQDYYELKAMVDAIRGGDEKNRFYTEKTNFAVLLDENDVLSTNTVFARLSTNNVLIDSTAFGHAEVDSLDGHFSSNDTYISINELTYGYGEYTASLKKLGLNTSDFEHIKLSFNRFDGKGLGIDLAANNLVAALDLANSLFSVGIASVETSSLEDLSAGWCGKTEVENIQLSGNFGESTELSALFQARLEHKKTGFQDLTLSSHLNVRLEDNSLKDFSLQLEQVDFGFGGALSSILLSGDLEHCDYSFRYGESAKLDGSAVFGERHARGSLILDDLKILDFYPFLGENKELVSNLTQTETGINGYVDFNLGFDSSASFRVVGGTDLNLHINGLHYNTFNTDLTVKANLEKELE